MTSELILAAMAFATAALFAARGYDRLQARRTDRLRARGNAFYASATKLLQNNEVTPDVLHLLDFMALSVSEANLVWDWTKMFIRRGWRPARKPVSMPAMTDSVRDDFVAMTIAGLYFIAEMYPVPGWVIRRHVDRLKQRSRQDPEKAEKATKALERWAHIDMTGDRRKRMRSSTSVVS